MPRARAGRSWPPTSCGRWPVDAAVTECRSLGELALKGLPDPVETVEVLWEPLGRRRDRRLDPTPRPPGRRPAVGVVGRETEMQTIADAAKRVAEGEGREVLLVSGEAGLGKTTLVAEAARAAFDDGACVLFGHCEEDLATPYQLFAEALGHYVTHAPEDQLLAHVEAHGSELSRLVPALASRIPDLPPSKATDADTERFLLFAAVVGLLATVSQHQPVVLVLDDLQWADKGSLLLLRHLAAAEQTMRVLVLGTYRDSELSRSHPLLDTLAALRRQQRGLPHRAGRTRRQRGGVAHGGRRRSHPRRRRGGPRPCRLPRDRRQPLLRERGAAPPVRDRGHLPGRHRAVDGGRLPGADGPARQRPRGDRRPGRAPRARTPDGCCRWRR